MSINKISCIIAFVVISSIAFCQGPPPPPPPMAIPTDAQAKLIDQIIEKSRFESFFYQYCKREIIAFARVNNWSLEKTNVALKAVKFEDFKSTIYNTVAFLSEETLTKIIDVYNTTDFKKESSPIVLMSDMTINNLEVYLSRFFK